MGKIAKQVGSELRLLPFMLGKLLGGLAAVIGFGTAVVIGTRPPVAAATLLPPLLAGVSGLVVFILAARGLARRQPHRPAAGQQPAQSRRQSLLAWGLLLLFAALFLAATFFLSR